MYLKTKLHHDAEIPGAIKMQVKKGLLVFVILFVALIFPRRTKRRMQKVTGKVMDSLSIPPRICNDKFV